MDKETVKYIMDYFFDLLPSNDRLAVHALLKQKKLYPIFKTKGFLTLDETLLNLCVKDYDAFEEAIVHKIMAEYADKVFFNKCPKCEKLARTPYAKQCRHCGHSWR